MKSMTRRVTVTLLAAGAATGIALLDSGTAAADVQFGPTFRGGNADAACHADIANEQQYAAPGYTVYCEAAPGGGSRIVIMTIDQLIPQTLQGLVTGSSNMMSGH